MRCLTHIKSALLRHFVPALSEGYLAVEAELSVAINNDEI